MSDSYLDVLTSVAELTQDFGHQPSLFCVTSQANLVAASGFCPWKPQGLINTRPLSAHREITGEGTTATGFRAQLFTFPQSLIILFLCKAQNLGPCSEAPWRDEQYPPLPGGNLGGIGVSVNNQTVQDLSGILRQEKFTGDCRGGLEPEHVKLQGTSGICPLVSQAVPAPSNCSIHSSDCCSYEMSLEDISSRQGYCQKYCCSWLKAIAQTRVANISPLPAPSETGIAPSVQVLPSAGHTLCVQLNLAWLPGLFSVAFLQDPRSPRPLPTLPLGLAQGYTLLATAHL